MSVNVIRLKRKAVDEPAEELVLSFKKSRQEDKTEEVHLKLAATITNEESSKNTSLQTSIKEKLEKEWLKQHPKQHHPVSSSLSERSKALKRDRKQNRLKLLEGRRLILAETIIDDKDKEHGEQEKSESESGLFKLYDVVNENEDCKPTTGVLEKCEGQSEITCNGQPLIRVSSGLSSNADDFVYDYYIVDDKLDTRLVGGSFSVYAHESTNELVLENEYEEPEEFYDDEDDSNDENNWRNDYPDEDSDYEKEPGYHDYNEFECDDSEHRDMFNTFNEFHIGDKESPAYIEYKTRILKEFESDED